MTKGRNVSPSTSKAIETVYPWPHGPRYRSRLEARWAVFFDRLGIPYEYEKEGYDFSRLLDPRFGWTESGAPSEEAENLYEYWRESMGKSSPRYLPDFWLPRHNWWIEIKADEPTLPELALAQMLAFETDCDVYIFYGDVRGPGKWDVGGTPAYKIWPGGGGEDSPYMWCECPTCGQLGIEFDARSDRLGCKESSDRAVAGCPRTGANRDKGYNGTSDRLMDAYAAARQARFEHGEHGR
jgi:hypothetical protein